MGHVGRQALQPRGSQGGRCDLIFLMVLSLVLLGCGGSLPHTRTGYVGGLEALELSILLKPCYTQHPGNLFIFIYVFRGCLPGEPLNLAGVTRPGGDSPA